MANPWNPSSIPMADYTLDLDGLGATETSSDEPTTEARLNVGGLFALVLFYFLIFLVGMYAGWKGKKYRNPAVPDKPESLPSMENNDAGIVLMIRLLDVLIVLSATENC